MNCIKKLFTKKKKYNFAPLQAVVDGWIRNNK